MLEQASTALDLLSLTCTGLCERVCGHVMCRPGRAETGLIVRRKQIVYGKAGRLRQCQRGWETRDLSCLELRLRTASQPSSLPLSCFCTIDHLFELRCRPFPDS